MNLILIVAAAWNDQDIAPTVDAILARLDARPGCMYYWIAANLLLVIHLGFVCFVLFGGLLVARWRWLLWLHLPAAIWGVLLEYHGWVCPLTPLEQWLRQAGGQAGYSGGFVEHYLLPLLYPGHLDRQLQIVLSVFVALINLAVYGWLLTSRYYRCRRSSQR